MLRTFAIASILIAVGSASSNRIVASTRWNTPCTLAKKWRALEPASVWAWSIFHVVGVAAANEAEAASRAYAARNRVACFMRVSSRIGNEGGEASREPETPE